MKLLTVYTLLLLTISCGSKEEKKHEKIETSKIILDAKALSYSELPTHIKIKASNSFIFAPIGSDLAEIDKEKGFYLRLTVDNALLAKACTDRGMWKETDLLDTTNLMGLYGKYRNRPDFYGSSDRLIPPTRKHEGYDLISVIRNKTIDTTYWGPVNEIPRRLVLYCTNVDSAEYPKANVSR